MHLMGDGHVSAAKSIKENIDLNYTDCKTELIDCMKYINESLERITTNAYKEMAKMAPWAWGKMYDKAKERIIC